MCAMTDAAMGVLHRRGIGVLWLVLASSLIAAPPPDEIRHAFSDIRDDNIPHNCEHATEWLLKYRAELKDDLLAELYRTDRQGRDAILHVLFNTPSFQPDERFIRFVLTRLYEQNRYVKSNTIFKDTTGALTWSGAHFEAWRFINDHYGIFEPYLKEELGKTNNVFVLWATAWLAKWRGVFADYAPLFTPAVLQKAAFNLKNDNVSYNASQAVRLFLLLGDQSLPSLREAAAAGDPQAKSLAKATMDALAGKRKAFGYLVSKLDIVEVLFGDHVQEPPWLYDEVQPYLESERPYQ
jgi:hypothetical protein